ncbi:MAG: hypothetical protein D6B26_02725 [Spirochaetaceae bacterium]|nr:MAG: hypothetical protein D6B26_02725 [Spirochaetaceae bacterium]
MSMPCYLICIFLALFSPILTAASDNEESQQGNTRQPSWIHTRSNITASQAQDEGPPLEAAAAELFLQQASSGIPGQQLDAVAGIAELISNERISPQNTEAIELIYTIAGQSFLMQSMPPVYPFSAQIAAVRQLGNMGYPAGQRLMNILRHEKNPSIAAEAAYHLPHVGYRRDGQTVLAIRLRNNRAVNPDPRFADALLKLAYKEATQRPLEDILINELMEYAYGSGTAGERRLAFEILSFVTE